MYSRLDTKHRSQGDAIDDIVEEHGALDIVVNNAGNQNRKPFVEYTQEEWESIQRVHVTGTFNVTQAAARHMVKRSFGRIIMMSSLSVAASRSTLALRHSQGRRHHLDAGTGV